MRPVCEIKILNATISTIQPYVHDLTDDNDKHTCNAMAAMATPMSKSAMADIGPIIGPTCVAPLGWHSTSLAHHHPHPHHIIT